MSTDHRTLSETVCGFATSAVRATRAPGIAVAAAKGSEATEFAAGYADLSDARRMTTDSVIRAGSMTKLYTATAVMQLVERGRLQLDDAVQAHLPQLHIRNPRGARDVTIEDLLAFRSGLAVDTTAAGFTPGTSLGDRLEQAYARPVLREYHSRLPLWTAAVGERYQYSNLGIATLGYLVEVASGEGTSFNEYVSEHILEPLGMQSSTLIGGSTPIVPEALRRRMATGYTKFGHSLRRSPDLWCADYPANGLITTVGDHLRLLMMLAQHGEYEGRRVLASESVDAMLQPRTPIGDLRISPDGTWWVGLAVMLANLGAADFHFGHPGGYMWGWWSISRVYPQLGLAYVIAVNAWDMTNWHNPTNPDAASLVAEALAAGVAMQGSSRSAARARESATRTWGWKRAYAAGLLVAERTYGFLGIAPDEQAERRIATTARACSVVPWSDEWDEQGFRAGVHDCISVGTSLTAIRGAAASGILQVDLAELKMLFVSLGGEPDVPLPLMFWPEG